MDQAFSYQDSYLDSYEEAKEKIRNRQSYY